MANGPSRRIKTQRPSSKHHHCLHYLLQPPTQLDPIKTPADNHSVVNPSTGEVLTSVPEGLPADVDRAVGVAREAFDRVWGTNTPGFVRGEILIKIAELIERDISILASLEALDNGKTFAVAKGFDVSANWLSTWHHHQSVQPFDVGIDVLYCRLRKVHVCLGTMVDGQTRFKARPSRCVTLIARQSNGQRKNADRLPGQRQEICVYSTRTGWSVWSNQ